MNNLQAFKYDNKQVRTIMKDNATWFVLKDVCDILELSSTTRTIERLEKDEVSLTHVIDSLGRKQETYIINESGLYSVILRSDKPQAKPFRKWVTAEVLPSIRKTGTYTITPRVPQNYVEALEETLRLAKETERLNEQITTDKPYTEYGKQVSNSVNAIEVKEFAKITLTEYKIGRNKLYKWLRNNGYLTKDNLPYQKFINQEILTIDQRIRLDYKTKLPTTYFVSLITGKGQIYLLEKLNHEFSN